MYRPICKARKRRSNIRKTCEIPSVEVPSEKHKRFALGQILVGRTDNELPDSWQTCRIEIYYGYRDGMVVYLDKTSVLIKELPDKKLINEIISTKIFAINIVVSDGEAYFDLYFTELPLPKFSKRIGTCIQLVMSLLYGCHLYSDECMDVSTELAVAKLYKDVRKVREQEQTSDTTEDMQHPRLNPELRPYQADAVRWMLKREKTDTDSEDGIHPLYTVITLKSGLDIYYNNHSGYIETEKPNVETPETPSKGGILADEMGLGKTVEVLACILQHPKHDSVETVDLKEKPTLEVISRKRKKEKFTPDTPVTDNSKKLKVPDNWVKSSSKKSQTYVALQTWYNSVLQSPTTSSPTKQENAVQCICGETTNKNTVTCQDCEKIQHSACLGYKKTSEPYRCPQCWMNQPLIECKATLIVTPVSLRTQWAQEICRHVRGDFKVLQYSGSSVTPIYPTDLTKYDIVLTTYNVLQNELRLTENEKSLSFRHQRRYSAPGSSLTRVMWWRLCLDEAQTVETTTSMVSAMAKKLNARFRWAVTGTPIAKDISDLHGLIDYLQMEPYNDISTWKHVLFNPYKRGQTAPMLKYLSQVLWRSSKDDLIDQINIPKQTIKEHWISFSTIEQFFYKCEHKSNRKTFLAKAKIHGFNTVLQSLDKGTLKTVLAPLLSLRQVCTFPNINNTRYFATRHTKKTVVKTLNDLVDALIGKNTAENEEFLRIVLSALNGLAGIYLLLQNPGAAIEQYRKVLQLHTRFTEAEKVAKLSIDKLQIIHTMHNLAETLEAFPPDGRTLRDDSLRKDCVEIEKQYIKKFINQSMTAMQECLLLSANVEKLQDSFVLPAGRWYSALLEWIYAHSYEKELFARIENLHSAANIQCSTDFRSARSLIYDISKWDTSISKLRQILVEVVHDLYSHCPDDEFQVIISQELVHKATDCHLRPVKKSGNKAKCAVCDANDHLKNYECKLFSMEKRTTTSEQEMGLKGSWKPTPQELIYKAILSIGRARNADADVIKDGEVHVNILDLLKKEFKEIRKLWTYLDQQVCAQDELDMCKIRLRLKDPKQTNRDRKDKVTPILKNLSYTLENKLETIHHINEFEVEHQRIVLENEAFQNLRYLEKNLGTRNYLETLYQERNENPTVDPCPICKSSLEKHWAIVPCGHSYCLECIQLLINQTRAQSIQCSVCRAYHHVTEISYTKSEEDVVESEEITLAGSYSTKVQNIVKLVLELKAGDSKVKILVFSSWVSVLSYIKEALVANEVSTELLASGTLEKQIGKFKDPKQHITALLLPLNLGGKGLNLVEATHVILTEPLLNPGEELQAIGRVHRIGQTRPTVVHKFFIKDTIEESIQNATTSSSQNWEKGKITIGQLVDLFGVQEDEAEPAVTTTPA